MNIFSGSLCLLIGYIFGCFQTSYFLSLLVSKKDIREIGSGNAGASNVTSELGWKYGLLTGILDILKAYIPAVLTISMFPDFPHHHLDMIIIAGTGAILGHIYPFFLNFYGGKGVACYIGMLLAVDYKIGVCVIIGLIIITIITDYISLGSITLYTSIPILAYIIGDYSQIIIQCLVVLFIVGMIKHWINIKRIIKGEEIGLRSVIYKNKSI